jgi:hypothetical protein
MHAIAVGLLVYSFVVGVGYVACLLMAARHRPGA